MKKRSTESDAQKRVERIVAAMNAASPDAESDTELVEREILEPVSSKDRHVVVTAIATHADAIITFNVADFAAGHLKEHLELEVIHPDDFVMDLVDLNEKRAVAASACSKEESTLGDERAEPAPSGRRPGTNVAMAEQPGCGRAHLNRHARKPAKRGISSDSYADFWGFQGYLTPTTGPYHDGKSLRP
jgi:hypothetical protein